MTHLQSWGALVAVSAKTRNILKWDGATARLLSALTCALLRTCSSALTYRMKLDLQSYVCVYIIYIHIERERWERKREGERHMIMDMIRVSEGGIIVFETCAKGFSRATKMPPKDLRLAARFPHPGGRRFRLKEEMLDGWWIQNIVQTSQNLPSNLILFACAHQNYVLCLVFPLYVQIQYFCQGLRNATVPSLHGWRQRWPIHLRRCSWVGLGRAG